MKNWLSLALVAFMGFCLVGCNNKPAPPAQEAVPMDEMPSPEEMDTTTGGGGTAAPN